MITVAEPCGAVIIRAPGRRANERRPPAERPNPRAGQARKRAEEVPMGLIAQPVAERSHPPAEQAGNGQ